MLRGIFNTMGWGPCQAGRRAGDMSLMKGGMRVSTERLLYARLWESRAILLNAEIWGFICLWPHMEWEAQGRTELQP